MKMVWSVLTMGFFFAALPVSAGDNMNAFPPPAEGQIRYVLQLPVQEDETNFKVELIVGKTVEIDEVNQYFFGGEITRETIAGWGFPRFLVSELGPMAGTLMAVDPDAPKTNRFIRIGGEPYLIRYNSRLPIVVYVPTGVDVRYRIWRADAEARIVEKG